MFLCEALCQIQEVCKSWGALIEITVRDESQVSRDDYESIKQYYDAISSTFTICAFPIDYQPDRHRLDRAGLFQESEVLITTPTKCWLDNGLSFLDIDIKRTTVQLGDESYKVREKGRQQVINLTPLYYTFGLYKE
jgi:hypothetical protein